MRDGSGLSAANLIAPATVVRVLAHAAGRPWADTFVDALAGRGEGTLRAWPRLPPLAAKTGTLRHTIALAGDHRPGLERSDRLLLLREPQHAPAVGREGPR